ncbi:RNA methyltransferase [Pullulanibacillus sp. KACC 23026]|uniref:TrmH family RNA methyltransferase n=1 Tax=Pullulanibacillus sp. KACC 23026 TaxID=3028315 RepID=UPI0023B0B667|nr:RNA methyltransferase [Pullulanibacillus sp. KACC 23026]WEG13925.1 RNA methyltransferase [Pullulanibacillus sp. KACC 23026]
MKRIESAQNATYKEWHKLEQKKWRDRAGQFLIEGPHLVEEALKTNQVVAVLIKEGMPKPYEETRDKPPLFELSEALFNSLVTTETPQGILAVVQLEKKTVTWESGRFLLIDAVQDPGNLGTMIRTADAAGFDYVVLGKGTVDAYNAKTLRSAQGSHFHIHLFSADLSDVILELKQQGIQVVGTSLEGESILDASPKKDGNMALLVGNEGAGVQSRLLEMADYQVKLPIYGQAESLNVAVAAGILMYWARGI